MTEKGKRRLALAIAIAVPQLVGILAGLATAEGTREWYPTLEKPSFTPPSFVFAPVWTALYLAMGIAAYRVWRLGAGGANVSPALTLFGIQLALNGAWSFLFFGMRSPFAGLVEILVLLAAVAATTVSFFRWDRTAGLLLTPYLAWVSYAALLNFAIWRLNA